MQQRIKNLLKGNFFIFSIFITLLIAYLSFIKIPYVGVHVPNSDKWGHSFAYFTLSLSWLLTFYKYPKKKYLIVVLCVFYGIIIEVLQHILTNHRTGDYIDAFANTAGILLGLVLFNQIIKKINVN